MSVVVLMFPEGHLRSRALGVWAAVASCGLVLGFVLSGVITEFLGWRWVFLVSVPFVMVVLVGVLWLIPSDVDAAEDKAKDQPVAGPTDVRGAVLLTIAPLLFVAGVVEAGEGIRPWWVPVSALIGAALATISLIGVERRAINPVLPPGILRNRNRLGANAATMLLSAALSTSFLLFTFLLQDRMGLSPMATGLALVPLAVCLVAASVVVPRLIERWGARACAQVGMVLAALGMAAIAVGAVWSWTMLPAMVFIAGGMGFGLVGLQYIAVSGVTEQDAATASGVQRAADQLGGALGVALFIGLGFGPTGGADGLEPYLISAAMAIVGLVVGVVVARRVVLFDRSVN